MLGGNIFGTSAFLFLGNSSLSQTLGNILMFLAIFSGIVVITSFITTRLLKTLVR